jgi:hypothetical protein
MQTVSRKWHDFCLTVPEFCSRLHFELPQLKPWAVSQYQQGGLQDVLHWTRKRAHLIRELHFRVPKGMSIRPSTSDPTQVKALLSSRPPAMRQFLWQDDTLFWLCTLLLSA